MTDVYIRHINSARGAKIGEVELSARAIDGIIPLLSGWGVVANDEDSAGEHAFGQFVVANGKAYFEVVVGEDPE